MKKFLIFFLVFLISLGSVSLVGCKKTDEVSDTEIQIADFENWAPDFQLLRLFNNFGKVTRNSDKKYVFEGEYSAKLQPIGEYINKSAPTMYFTTTSSLFDFDYKDFTYYDEVVAHIYNATDEVRQATIGLVSSVGGLKQISTAPGQTVTLLPGQWTRIDYWLDLDLITLSANVKDICGIYFKFENAGVLDVKDGPTFYLDDIRLVKAEERRTVNDLIELDGNEICDFEKPYQEYIVQSELAGPEASTFSLKVVKTADYDVEPISGEKALLLVRHPAPLGTKYSRMLFPETLMRKVGMDKVPAEEYKSTYFCFNVYNASKGDASGGHADTFYLSSWFTYDGGKGLIAPNRLVADESGKNYPTLDRFYEYGEFDTTNSAGHYAPYGKWSEYRISLYEIMYGGGSENHIKTPGYFAILISAFSGEEDRLVFLDNFRLEEGEPVYVKPVVDE